MKNIFFVIAFTTVSLISTTTFAAGNWSGQLSRYHLNADVSGRGACITMNPPLAANWACLWLNNPLYKEINALLLSAYIAGRTCTVYWATTDAIGEPIIQVLECI